MHANNDNGTLLDSVRELRESVTGWQSALNELEQVMLARGLVTQAELDARRQQ